MANVTNTKKNEITTGVIWKQILLFFFPILIGVFFQQLYNTVDAAVVGQFAGREALASVGGSSGQILNFVFSFFMGLATGATVIIAQHYGAGEEDRVDDALHTAYTFAIVGGIVLGIICIFLARPFLLLLRTPGDLMEMSTLYVRVLMSGLVFALVYNIGAGILRAIGDSKRPLYILIACCGLNIVLDLVFVMILHMGILGAAIATDLCQAFSAAMVTYLLARRTPGMQLSIRRLHINPRTLLRILKIGLPTAIADSMFSISNMMVQGSVNSMGVNTVAAWTAYGKLDAFWWMINQAFGVATTTFIGQNFGAGRTDRIKKGTRTVVFMQSLAAVVMSGFILLGTPILLRLFTNSPEVIEIGIRMSRILGPFYITFVLNEVLTATLRAENDVMFGTISNLLGVCVYRIIWVTFVVPRTASLTLLLWCYPISWIAISLLMTLYYLYRQPRILRNLRSITIQNNILSLGK